MDSYDFHTLSHSVWCYNVIFPSISFPLHPKMNRAHWALESETGLSGVEGYTQDGLTWVKHSFLILPIVIMCMLGVPCHLSHLLLLDRILLLGAFNGLVTLAHDLPEPASKYRTKVFIVCTKIRSPNRRRQYFLNLPHAPSYCFTLSGRRHDAFIWPAAAAKDGGS